MINSKDVASEIFHGIWVQCKTGPIGGFFPLSWDNPQTSSAVLHSARENYLVTSVFFCMYLCNSNFCRKKIDPQWFRQRILWKTPSLDPFLQGSYFPWRSATLSAGRGQQKVVELGGRGLLDEWMNWLIQAEAEVKASFSFICQTKPHSQPRCNGYLTLKKGHFIHHPLYSCDCRQS